MTETPKPTVTGCPVCGQTGTGKYCGECGAVLRNVECTVCGTALVPGASYCHRCGAGTNRTAAEPARRGTATQPGEGGNVARSHRLAWAVGTLAFVALAALVLWRRPSVPEADGGQAEAAAPLSESGGAVGLAPDISSMSPRERAERLFDHAMRANEAGKTDSARFFASMATMAYQQLDALSLDDRYDLGRLALLAGAIPLASAQADTILAQRPTHLLGLMLSEDVARARHDSRAAAAAHAKFLSVAATEKQVALPEYSSHASEIAATLKPSNPAAPPPP